MSELLSAVAAAPAAIVSEGLLIESRPAAGLASIMLRRGRRAEVDRRMRDVYGVPLPVGPRRTVGPSLALIGTGPAALLAVRQEPGYVLAAELGDRLAGLAAVADQSSAYEVLRLSGPRARATLQKAVAVDLDPAAFGRDGCLVTAIGHVGCILWQAEDEAFDIAVARSMAADLRHGLGDRRSVFSTGAG